MGMAKRWINEWRVRDSNEQERDYWVIFNNLHGLYREYRTRDLAGQRPVFCESAGAFARSVLVDLRAMRATLAPPRLP